MLARNVKRFLVFVFMITGLLIFPAAQALAQDNVEKAVKDIEQAFKEKDYEAVIEMTNQVIPELNEENSTRIYSLFFTEGYDMKASAAQQLENDLIENPDQFLKRILLVSYYFQARFTDKELGPLNTQHVLWIIKHHPDAECLHILSSLIGINPIMDGQDNYNKAKDLWMKHLDEKPEDLKIIRNAANFFLQWDQPLAQELLEKAQKLDPENTFWSQQLGHLHSLATIGKNLSPETVQGSYQESFKSYEQAYASSNDEEKKFYLLNDLAQSALKAGLEDKAQHYAQLCLSKAENYKDNWNYGNALHHAHIVLGKLALKQGDIEQAKHHLIQAGLTPGSPQLNSFGPNMSLANELFNKGELDTVIQYLESCKNFWETNRGQLDDWIVLIKNGRKPNFKGY